MRRHAEQRLALLQAEKLSPDDELDAIRDEMTRERANALKEQEVRLAAMLAELQMAKAKEVGDYWPPCWPSCRWLKRRRWVITGRHVG